MKTFKLFNESNKNVSFQIYFRRYSQDTRYKISDLYYDVEQVIKHNIEYYIFNNYVKGEEYFFYLYLFPSNEYEEKFISSEYIGRFNASSIYDEKLSKEENIELIKTSKNANIINLEDVNLIINSNKFNI